MERRLLDCPDDILLLVLDELLGATEALCHLGLTCRRLQRLVLPFLLEIVDLSSHNNGRLPDCEDEVRPEVYADFGSDYRPLNLVTRQRAFLRLITDRPELASHVRSFTWTLIWADFDETSLAEIDFELWNVFSRLNNVRKLDLASSLEADSPIVAHPFIRKNPSRLFPAVTHLRLLGWMHRGLVDAIVNSLDPKVLRTLILDYLQDEGAFPNGDPMPHEVVAAHAHNIRFSVGRQTVSEELYRRQQHGLASVFPGPMWTPLRMLSSRRCNSLTRFELRLAPFHATIDLRNYYTCFEEAAKFLSTVRRSLKSLTILFGESPSLSVKQFCGTARVRGLIVRTWSISLALDFLRTLLLSHNQSDFPFLEEVTAQGFHILGDTDEQEQDLTSRITNTCGLDRNYLFCPGENIVAEPRPDWRPVFTGYDYTPKADTLQEFFQLLEQS